VRRGTLSEVAAYYESNPPKGEVTLVVAPTDGDEGGEEREELARSLAQELLRDGLMPSKAAKEVAARLDLARNEAYRIVHELLGR